VSSDDAAEAWARENGWARPDEVLVVVLAPEGETEANSETSPAEDAGPATSRDSWWDLFFGRNLPSTRFHLVQAIWRE
jgi:hypothetical protein